MSINVRSQYLLATNITVYGDMLSFSTSSGLYLSGNNYNLETVDLYSGVKNLSASNPPFSGIPIASYNVKDNNSISFNLPENLIPGLYDVIFCNPAGYYIASRNKKFNYIRVI